MSTFGSFVFYYYGAKLITGASPYSMGPASGTATPMMSPAPQDSMGYSLGGGQPPYDPPQSYDSTMPYDPMHQDLSP